MADEISPQTRMYFRAAPGAPASEKRSVGRSIWIGTTRFISFLGGITRPVAEAWNLAGGPGGQGAVVLANFMQKFGNPRVQHMNEKVYLPRAQMSADMGMQTLNELNGEVKISTEATDTVGGHLAERYDAMQRVADTRFDAMTHSAADFEE